jgi:excisionase family DNA binding protein
MPKGSQGFASMPKEVRQAIARLGGSATQGTGTARKGFAALSKAKQQEIARLGGIAAHAQGKAHTYTREEAKIAGRKGGQHPKKHFLTFTPAKRIKAHSSLGMEEYVTPHEAALLLRVSYRTIRRWIRAGKLQVETIREGRRNHHRIKKAIIDALETPSPPPGFV